jgi:drug/metabolite transporter (DMT)-like permease
LTQGPLPTINRDFALWILLGALTQIGATALMLMTMEQRSFVVTIAYLKTEPVLVALMGLAFLGDPLTAAMALAILTAMAGVALISVKPEALTGGLRPALLGLSSAALFAASAIGYRGAILASDQPSFVLGATLLAGGGPQPANPAAAGLAADLQAPDTDAPHAIMAPQPGGGFQRRGGVAMLVSGLRFGQRRQRAHPGPGGEYCWRKA